MVDLVLVVAIFAALATLPLYQIIWYFYNKRMSKKIDPNE